MSFLKKLKQSISGATAIEYALIASMIAVAIVGSVSALGVDLNDVFESVSDGLTGA
jgi:pilus assembly protein Flp/PilA